MRASPAIICVLALAACATPPSSDMSGGSTSPDYRDGYDDGCEAGNHDGAIGAGLIPLTYHVHRDQAHYNDLTGDYRRGWDAGHRDCFQTASHPWWQ